MSKELTDLLENEVLSNGAKDSIKEAFESRVNEAKEDAKKELETEYAEYYTNKIQEHSENVQSLIDEAVKEEIEELKEDLRYYADLEVKYANELETFKEEHAEKMSEVVGQLIAETVRDEFAELEQDLTEAKKFQFGKELFEAFQTEYERKRFTESPDEVRNKLAETEQKLEETQKEADKLRRDSKLNELLEGLSGSKRRVMETILDRVETDRLEERYNEVIDSILKEEKSGEKEEKLNESTSNDKGSEETISEDRVVVEGDESKEKVINFDISRDLRLAGIKK